MSNLQTQFKTVRLSVINHVYLIYFELDQRLQNQLRPEDIDRLTSPDSPVISCDHLCNHIDRDLDVAVCDQSEIAKAFAVTQFSAEGVDDLLDRADEQLLVRILEYLLDQADAQLADELNDELYDDHIWETHSQVDQGFRDPLETQLDNEIGDSRWAYAG